MENKTKLMVNLGANGGSGGGGSSGGRMKHCYIVSLNSGEFNYYTDNENITTKTDLFNDVKSNYSSSKPYVCNCMSTSTTGLIYIKSFYTRGTSTWSAKMIAINKTVTDNSLSITENNDNTILNFAASITKVY